MKKIYVLCLSVISLFLITACGSKKYTTYEYHYYDKDFNHTEDAIVKYDKDGNIVEYEEITLYDKVTDKSACDVFKSDKKEEGYSQTCETTDKGTKVSYKVTKKYFDNHKADMDDLDGGYSALLKEETAKELFNNVLKELKEEVPHSDEYNYVVIANKKIEW